MTTDDDLDPAIARRFGAIDTVQPPDVWSRVTSEMPQLPRERPRHAVLVAAVVLTIVVAGVVAIAIAAGGDDPTATTGFETTAQPPASATLATTSPSIVYGGGAQASPPVVERGSEMTVTPLHEIAPNCTKIAMVNAATPSGLQPLGQLAPDGRWVPVPEGGPPTWLACGDPSRAAGITCTIPHDLVDGTYVLCCSGRIESSSAFPTRASRQRPMLYQNALHPRQASPSGRAADQHA